MCLSGGLCFSWAAVCARDSRLTGLRSTNKYARHEPRARPAGLPIWARIPYAFAGVFAIVLARSLARPIGELARGVRYTCFDQPLIAAAQGKTIAGGLMLLWVADVIVAADDALFSDPVVGMGVNGVEYFAHPWEWGARKAKELLFTGDWVTADEAHRLGMVNHVVPAAELRPFVMSIAGRIARRPSFALKLAKESVNQTLEAQGQWTALRAAFSIQHLAHAHNRVRFGIPVDPGPPKPDPS